MRLNPAAWMACCAWLGTHLVTPLVFGLLTLVAASGAMAMGGSGDRPSEVPEQPHRYAVVVGSNQGLPGEENLKYAEQDARRVAEILVDLAGIPQENLVLLQGPSVAELSRVLKRVRRRLEAEAERSVDRPGGKISALFTFYYSGHADSHGLHVEGESLSYEELNRQLDAVEAPARLVIVDACQSGDLTRVKGGRAAEPFNIGVQEQFVGEGVAIITSSAVGEDAQESERLLGGVFTHHFIAGLRGAADASRDGRVTLNEVYRYSRRQTIRSTSRAPFVQHPSYAYDLRGRNDLVLTWMGESRSRGFVRFVEGGDFLLFGDGDDEEEVLEINVPAAATVSVVEGAYTLRERREGRVFEKKIEIEPRRTTVVRAREMSAIPLAVTVRRGQDENRRGSMAIVVAAGMAGPLLPHAQRPGYAGSLGFLFDLRALSIGSRFRYRYEYGEQEPLRRHQHALGADLTLYKFFDLRRFSPGIGLRVGLDWVRQNFETPGLAPTRDSLVFRGGPVIALRFHFSARWSALIDIGLDTALLRTETPGDEDSLERSEAWIARPMPFAQLGVSLALF